jgi:hypothetical protein
VAAIVPPLSFYYQLDTLLRDIRKRHASSSFTSASRQLETCHRRRFRRSSCGAGRAAAAERVLGGACLRTGCIPGGENRRAHGRTGQSRLACEELQLASNTDLLYDAVALFRWAVSERKLALHRERERKRGTQSLAKLASAPEPMLRPMP